MSAPRLIVMCGQVMKVPSACYNQKAKTKVVRFVRVVTVALQMGASSRPTPKRYNFHWLFSLLYK